LTDHNKIVIIEHVAAPRTIWSVESYQELGGRVPVDHALQELSATDQARVLRVIDLLVNYGPTLKMPHALHMQGKLWELRMDGRPNSYRLLYAAVPGRKFLLLHLFAKKSQKTPEKEIATANRRLDDYKKRIKP
jgi:phage-related protein